MKYSITKEDLFSLIKNSGIKDYINDPEFPQEFFDMFNDDESWRIHYFNRASEQELYNRYQEILEVVKSYKHYKEDSSITGNFITRENYIAEEFDQPFYIRYLSRIRVAIHNIINKGRKKLFYYDSKRNTWRLKFL